MRVRSGVNILWLFDPQCDTRLLCRRVYRGALLSVCRPEVTAAAAAVQPECLISNFEIYAFIFRISILGSST